MRKKILAGLLCLSVASLVFAQDIAKDQAFVPTPKSEVDKLDGVWEATVKTADGWTGTLRATVSLKPTKVEDAPFHGTIATQCNLERKNTKYAGGTGIVVITPVKKDKQRFLHSLRELDYTVLQLHEKNIREEEKELADLEKKKNKNDAEIIALIREDIKDLKKLAAELQPNEKNTAAYTLDGDTLTIESKGLILPEPLRGGKIRWDDKIVFKRVKVAGEKR